MIIKSLEIENIRSYGREKIDFKDGIALFEGDIGCGKSTILYAIEFALFGLGDIKSTFLLRHGEKEGHVTLVMNVDGKDISFMRSLERKKSGASQKQCCIIKDGVKTDYSAEEMKAEVLKILKFNENPSPTATSLIYRYAIFTPQEEMKEILRLREDMRLETLRRAFGIEEYRIAKNNVSLVAREIKEREAYISGGLKDMDSLALRKEELTGQLRKCEHDMEELKAKHSAVERKKSSLKSKAEEHRKTKAEYDRILGELPVLTRQLRDKKALAERGEKTIAGLSAEMLEKGKRLESLESEKKPTEKTEDELTNELRKIRDEINRLSAEAGGLKNSIKEAESAAKDAEDRQKDIGRIGTRIAELGELKKPTEETDSKLAEKISAIRKRADALLRQSGATRGQSETFRKLIDEGVCPTCERPIDSAHFHKRSEDARASLDNLEKELGQLHLEEKAIEKMREELAGYRFKEEKLAGLLREKEMHVKAHELAVKKSSGIDALKLSLSLNKAASEKYALEESGISKLHSALLSYLNAEALCSQLRQDIDALGNRLESEKSVRVSVLLEVSGTEKEIREKEVELKQKESSVKELIALEREMEAVAREEGTLVKLAGEADANLRAINAERAKIDAELLRKESEKKELDALSETRMWLDDYFSGALVSIERHVLASINEEFNTLFVRLFRILMEENELNVSVNEYFTPAVSQNGYEQDVNALSGGERTSVALAYRLALNSVVKGVSAMSTSGLLILDEPTDGFSKEQLMKLRDVLSEVGCRQVIVVSHERELESFADHIYRVRKAGSVSAVEKG